MGNGADRGIGSDAEDNASSSGYSAHDHAALGAHRGGSGSGGGGDGGTVGWASSHEHSAHDYA
eukprot:15429920-Alexandrium_andersonii.AAC.1